VNFDRIPSSRLFWMTRRSIVFHPNISKHMA
jgi:hypothetical protein